LIPPNAANPAAYVDISPRCIGYCNVVQSRSARLFTPTARLSEGKDSRCIFLPGRYGLSFYDAMILASALRAGCKILYSEDLQDRQVIDRKLRIRSPFASPENVDPKAVS
jgi:hypothetical protein